MVDDTQVGQQLEHDGRSSEGDIDAKPLPARKLTGLSNNTIQINKKIKAGQVEKKINRLHAQAVTETMT